MRFILAALVLALAVEQGADAKVPDRLSLGPHEAHLADVTLHYVVAGRGSPVLVPSPSWGPGSLYLQRGLRPLEAHHRLIFIDSRGSGGSSRPTDEKHMSIVDMANDIESMREYLGLEKIDLIGHSASGTAAIEYAERYDDHVAHLVLVEAATAWGTTAGDVAEEKQRQDDWTKLASDPRYADAIHHLMNDPFPPTNDDAMMRSMQDTVALYFANPAKGVPLFRRTMVGMKPSSFAARTSGAADHVAPLEQERRLGSIHAASLVVQGKQDWIVPVIVADHLHSGIAESRLLELDNCGHFPWIEQPTKFFAAVEEFLQGEY